MPPSVTSFPMAWWPKQPRMSLKGGRLAGRLLEAAGCPNSRSNTTTCTACLCFDTAWVHVCAQAACGVACVGSPGEWQGRAESRASPGMCLGKAGSKAGQSRPSPGQCQGRAGSRAGPVQTKSRAVLGQEQTKFTAVPGQGRVRAGQVQTKSRAGEVKSGASLDQVKGNPGQKLMTTSCRCVQVCFSVRILRGEGYHCKCNDNNLRKHDVYYKP